MSETTCPACHTKNPPQNNYCHVCGTLLKPTLVGENKTCPFCQQPIKDTDLNCPNCGRKIREKPLSTSIWAQIGIYSLSFFVPPFGVMPAVKYLKQKDSTHRWIGSIALILTIVSIVVSIYYTVQIVNQVNEGVNKQLQNVSF